VRGRLPVAGTERIGHAHHDRGQPALSAVPQHQVLGLHAGLDVAACLVERVVFTGLAIVAKGDRPDRAGEDEPLQIGPGGNVEDMTQTLDVGLEQRSGIAQPRTGVTTQ
jgi:hypothetical protein